MIYFVQAHITKKIKIGFTTQWIDTRLGVMQSNSPDQLNFLGGLVGDKKEEKRIQKKFEYYLSHGEWFNECKELLNFIKDNCLKSKSCFDSINELILDGSVTLIEAQKLNDEDIKRMTSSRRQNIFENVLKNIC